MKKENSVEALWGEALRLRAKLGKKGELVLMGEGDGFVVGYAHYDDLVPLGDPHPTFGGALETYVTGLREEVRVVADERLKSLVALVSGLDDGD